MWRGVEGEVDTETVRVKDRERGRDGRRGKGEGRN